MSECHSMLHYPTRRGQSAIMASVLKIISRCLSVKLCLCFCRQIDPKPCTPRGMQPEKSRNKEGWVRQIWCLCSRLSLICWCSNDERPCWGDEQTLSFVVKSAPASVEPESIVHDWDNSQGADHSSQYLILSRVIRHLDNAYNCILTPLLRHLILISRFYSWFHSDN